MNKPYINWSHVAAEFKYLAVDKSGKAYLYRLKPEAGNDIWDCSLGEPRACPPATHFASLDTGSCAWDESLVCRPGHEEGQNDMSKTEIFDSYADFLARKDKTINGVSVEFANEHPNYKSDNASNTGCWNCYKCDSCTHCVNCKYCDRCMQCHHSSHGTRSLECHGCHYFDSSSYCQYCYSCVDLNGCEGCNSCAECERCERCNYCYRCTNCKDSSYLDECRSQKRSKPS